MTNVLLRHSSIRVVNTYTNKKTIVMSSQARGVVFWQVDVYINYILYEIYNVEYRMTEEATRIEKRKLIERACFFSNSEIISIELVL